MKDLATASLASAGIWTLIMSFMFIGILKKLWSVLNSRQLEAYMPMLESLKFPGNATKMNEFLIELVTFDFIPTYLIDSMLYYFPDSGPFSMN